MPLDYPAVFLPGSSDVIDPIPARDADIGKHIGIQDSFLLFTCVQQFCPSCMHEPGECDLHSVAHQPVLCRSASLSSPLNAEHLAQRAPRTCIEVIPITIHNVLQSPEWDRNRKDFLIVPTRRER